MKTVTVKLSDRIYSRLAREARQRKITVTALIAEIVAHYLDR